MSERKTITIQNTLVSYLAQGGDAGKMPLILLHGWRSEAAVWTGALGGMNQDGIPAYALDLPGFGKSENPPRAFCVGDYADLVAGFMEKLGIARAVVVGHSFGGRIGIVLAAEKPGLVSRLVLVDAAGIREASLRRSLAQAGAMIAKPLFAPRFMQPLRKRIYALLGADDYLATPALQETYLRVINEDLTPLLLAIKQETLLVWGEKDRDTPLREAETMKRNIAHSRLVIIPGAGHFSFLDAPEKFLAALRSFITSA